MSITASLNSPAMSKSVLPSPGRAMPAPARETRVPFRTSGRGPRRRKISPEAGRALEILGHAIDYLADEFALDCISGQTQPFTGVHPCIVAIEVLKACNREVYLSCPEIPTVGERMQLWLRSWQRA